VPGPFFKQAPLLIKGLVRFLAF